MITMKVSKHILIASVLLSTIAYSADELAWVDTQIEAIKPPRKGMSSAEVARVKSPFIFLEKNKSPETQKINAEKAKNAKENANVASTSNGYVSPDGTRQLFLGAIINNSALINGTWFKKGDKVYGYKLSTLTAKTAILHKGEKKLILSTGNKNSNIKFK